MIALAIIVALEAIVCVSLEMRFEKLVKKHNELVNRAKDIAQATAEMGEALQSAQDKSADVMEELFEFIKEVDSRVADVSHETKEIKSYYCNYVSKKGNE